MSVSKYIRPMSFWGTLGSMYGLYLKIMIPILILNSLLVAMSWWVLLVGAFVGPILIMTSNAILGKSPKVFDSFRRGIFSISFLKIALVSVVYISFTVILPAFMFFVVSSSLEIFDPGASATFIENYLWPWLGIITYSYLFLSPIWIFIPMIMLLEKKGLRTSIKRSFVILRKNLLRILLMDIFITGFTALVAYWLASLGGGAGEFFALSSLAVIFLPLFTGFSTLPYVFIYYEYRARYENYSEELLTEEMGYQPIEEMMTV